MADKPSRPALQAVETSLGSDGAELALGIGLADGHKLFAATVLAFFLGCRRGRLDGKAKDVIEGLGDYHPLKALTYFAEAENDPDPQMLVPVSWGKVKAGLAAAAREAAERLGIAP